jgi:hypothetical protein
MGLAEVARDALKEIPLSEVLRERVSLALDRLAEAERQIAVMQTEKGGLQAQLERERIDHEQTKKELQKLQELMREEVRFVRGVEFRKGSRTGDKWQPFCPKCHLPVVFSRDPRDPIFCSDQHTCRWSSGDLSPEIQRESQSLSQTEWRAIQSAPTPTNSAESSRVNYLGNNPPQSQETRLELGLRLSH